MRKIKTLKTLLFLGILLIAVGTGGKLLTKTPDAGTWKQARDISSISSSLDEDLRSALSTLENAGRSDSDSTELHGPYKVKYVIDGDTAVIEIDGEETKVRFIGIDTPESVNTEHPEKNCPEGEIASAFTKAMLREKSVYIEYDVEREDDYGRTLAYLYLDNGKTMVQKEILLAGMATTMTIQPNSRHAVELYEAQVQAREAGSGFWATGFYC